jgi:predicted nuclease of restriction endonuclease-like RecB superfamily
LSKKLAQLEHAQVERLILCVDQARSCSRKQFEALGPVVWFKRWIDVREVIAVVDPALFSELAQRRGAGEKLPNIYENRAAK